MRIQKGKVTITALSTQERDKGYMRSEKEELGKSNNNSNNNNDDDEKCPA